MFSQKHVAIPTHDMPLTPGDGLRTPPNEPDRKCRRPTVRSALSRWKPQSWCSCGPLSSARKVRDVPNRKSPAKERLYDSVYGADVNQEEIEGKCEHPTRLLALPDSQPTDHREGDKDELKCKHSGKPAIASRHRARHKDHDHRDKRKPAQQLPGEKLPRAESAQLSAQSPHSDDALTADALTAKELFASA